MRLSVLKYLLLMLAQVAVWNYFDFSPYVMITFLPALILCLPIAWSPVLTMLIAFATGIGVDFLVTGQLGMTSLSLVPVGLLRRGVVRLVFGSELFARGEELSFHRQGWQKFLLCTVILTALHLIIQIWVDGAGMYSLGFNVLKLGISLLVSTAVAVAIAFLMLEPTGERWK